MAESRNQVALYAAVGPELMHYAVDVLVGLALAAVAAWLAPRIVGALQQKDLS